MEHTGAHVRIVGHGRMHDDMQEKARTYTAFPLMRHYFPTPADTNYTLIEIIPTAVTVKGAWELEYHHVPL